MKRITLVLSSIIIALLSFLGCVKTPVQNVQDAENSKSYCFDYQIRSRGSIGGNFVIETDDTVYFLLNGFLYFSDKDVKEFMPLCSRPDCNHTDMDCNAYIDATTFTVYGDHIYYLDGCAMSGPDTVNNDPLIPVLRRMRLDGTAHEKVIQLPVPEKEFTPNRLGWYYAFSNKYLIVGCNQANETDLAFDMYTLELDTLELQSVTCDWANFHISWPFLMAGRSDLIYCTITDNTDFVTDGTQIRYFCELNCAAGEIRKIGVMPNDFIYPEFSYYLADDSVWYICSDGAGAIKINRIDLISGNVDTLLESTASQTLWTQFDWENGLLFADKKLAGQETQPGLYFSGLDFKLLDSHIFTDDELSGLSGVNCIFQTESYIFGIGPDKYGAYSVNNGVPEWYIDKADIGTGSLMWKRWEP